MVSIQMLQLLQVLRFSVPTGASISDTHDILSKLRRNVAALEYYLSVTEFLIELQRSGEGRGTIAIMCPKPFANGEWMRTISQIMRCGNDCVKLRFM